MKTRIAQSEHNVSLIATVEPKTELVVELLGLSPNQKEATSSISAQFYDMPESYKRVHVHWHCAKVQGHAEPVTVSYDFPKLYHSNPKSLGANVHLGQVR